VKDELILKPSGSRPLLANKRDPCLCHDHGVTEKEKLDQMKGQLGDIRQRALSDYLSTNRCLETRFGIPPSAVPEPF